jgi:hypothetical protein
VRGICLHKGARVRRLIDLIDVGQRVPDLQQQGRLERKQGGVIDGRPDHSRAVRHQRHQHLASAHMGRHGGVHIGSVLHKHGGPGGGVQLVLGVVLRGSGGGREVEGRGHTVVVSDRAALLKVDQLCSDE